MLQALLLLVAIVILRSTRGCEASTTVQTQNRLFIIVGIATTLMVTSLSIYPSMLIPRIEVAAFPWRWIAVASVFTSLLAGAAAERLARPDCLDRKKLWASCAAIVAVVMLNLWITVQFVIIRPMSNPTIKSTVGLLESNYTPKDATSPTALPNSAPVTVHPGGGASEIVRFEPQYRKIALRVDQPSQLRLKTYNFPGWTARIDGEKVPLSSDQDGVQVMSVQPGIHNIEVEFVDTKPRLLGAMLFGLGLLTIAGLIALDYRQRMIWRGAEANDADAKAPSHIAWDNGAKDHDVRPRATTVVVTIAVAATVIVALLLATWLGTRSKSSSGQESKEGATRSGHTTGGINAGVGSEVRLYLEGQTSVPVAVDERAFDELISALSTRRQDSVETLIQSGRVFRADNDTPARILEVGLAKIKVRIVEGPHITKDGWIHERWAR